MEINTSEKENQAEGLIEIQDPEIDPEALMAEIRRRIEARRAELGYETRRFPSFGEAVPCPDPPIEGVYSAALYHHLRQANNLYAEVETEPVLAASAALRVPVLGRLWRLVRGQAHGLILYYVNRGLAHQMSVNRHLISVLNELTVENEALKRQVATLQAQSAAQPNPDKE